ncbi:MAG: beta-lactamase family protein [Verrucomicrobium sp.]|nr:beta-lactamase family protein [Verrucomicrobium sp.]
MTRGWFLVAWMGWFGVLALGRAQAPDPAWGTSARLQRLRDLLPRLDALYEGHAVSNHIPGHVWGLVVDGRLVHVRASGLACVEPTRTVTPDTRFRIASMSKSLTAAAILRLRDEGRLSLEDPVAKHLPEFRKVRPATPDSPAITLRHLLRMSGGFPQDDPWGDRKLAETDAQLDALVAGGLTAASPTGTRWEYSNLGYALLGRVITRVAREPYQAYITRRILTPLGMTNSVYAWERVPPEHLALGYRWEDDRWKPEPMLGDGSWGAMGGLITTLGDFARYVAFHLEAWPPREAADTGPLQRATRREMHRPWEVVSVLQDLQDAAGKPVARVAGYGPGLAWNQDQRGIIWVRHAGGLPGFGSEFRFLPDHGIALIAFANRTYAPMSAVNQKAMELLIHEAKIPNRPVEGHPTLFRRAEELATLLTGDWKPEALHAALAPNVFLDHGLETWRRETRALLDRVGPIRDREPLVPENRLRGRFRLVGRERSLEVFLTLTPEATPRIQEIRLTVVGENAR